MKIFKKGEEFDGEVVESSAAAAPQHVAAGSDNDITDLVDWYLNPDAPSPVVDQQATDWTSPAAYPTIQGYSKVCFCLTQKGHTTPPFHRV